LYVTNTKSSFQEHKGQFPPKSHFTEAEVELLAK
jgi:hypothetical protein